MTEQLQNFGETTLNGAINDTTTSVVVTDGSVFPASGNFRINVEDELMKVTARSTNTLTVERGSESTTAASHSSGVAVTLVTTAESLVQAIRENAAGVGVIGASAYNSTTQSVANGSIDLCDLDSVAWDTDSFFDNVNDRLTVPAGLGGTYIVLARTTYATNGTGGRFLFIYKNGSIAQRTAYIAGAGTRTVESQAILELAAGDYVDVRALQYSGGALDIGDATQAYATTIEIVKLGTGTVGETIGASVEEESTQSIATATSTDVTFDTVVFDTDGFFDLGGANPERFTVPAGLGGKYLFVANVTWAYNGSGYRQGDFIVNGTDQYGKHRVPPDTIASSTTDFTLSTIIDLSPGDEVSVEVRQTSGGNLDIGGTGNNRTQFSGVLLATAGSGGLKEGTAFPVGPTTGQRFRRTDLDYMMFFYDGTRWLSEQEFTVDFEETVSGATLDDTRLEAGPPWRNGLDVYMTRIDTSTYVTTTNDGSNYWSFHPLPNDGSTWNQGSAYHNTSALSPSVWARSGAAINSVLAADEGFALTLRKSGGPGSIYFMGTLRYRLIAT